MVKFPVLGRATSWSKVRETCVRDQAVLDTCLRFSEGQERKRCAGWVSTGYQRETCTEQPGCAIYQTLNTVFEVAQAKSGKGELFHCLVVCRNQTLSAVFKNGSQGRMGRRVCPRVTPPIHLGALCSLMPARECICSAALRDKDWAHLTLSGTTAPFQVPNLEYFWIQAAGLGMSNQ